jgi:hypothetical protein
VSVQWTLGKGELFAECYSGALGTGFVAVTNRRGSDFVPDKKYSTKKSLPMYSSSSFLCRVSIPGFAEYFRHSTKKRFLVVYIFNSDISVEYELVKLGQVKTTLGSLAKLTIAY